MAATKSAIAGTKGQRFVWGRDAVKLPRQPAPRKASGSRTGIDRVAARAGSASRRGPRSRRIVTSRSTDLLRPNWKPGSKKPNAASAETDRWRYLSMRPQIHCRSHGIHSSATSHQNSGSFRSGAGSWFRCLRSSAGSGFTRPLLRQRCGHADRHDWGESLRVSHLDGMSVMWRARSGR